MGSVGQSESGKAWEYGLAKSAADIFSVPLDKNSPCKVALISYQNLEESERVRVDRAAREAITFLQSHDEALNDVDSVYMQSDMEGRDGDVRDIIARADKKEIGISAKHRHKAVKHPRLSPRIDFGKQWYGVPCSDTFKQAVKPVWDRLQKAKDDGKMWSEIIDKQYVIYAPVVRAFLSEIRMSAHAEKLLCYMLGKYDFYKVVKDNGNVLLQSFNLSGSLGWGNKLPLPSRIVDVDHTRETTGTIIFDRGWAMSFRLHNAESKVKPTMKFDVNLVGVPLDYGSHIIPYDRF